ncbi:MAG: hypothetical protein NVSMB57_02030 [Actinomycetota bacterium]
MNERGVDRRAFLRLAALLSASAPIVACSGSKRILDAPRTASARPSSTSQGIKAAADAALTIGSRLPRVKSEAIEGPEIDLENYRGRPFILNFWASTCDPCVREFPLLARVIERHSDFPIVGVDVLERKAPAARFARTHRATWPSIWDPDGTIAQTRFQVRVLPVTYAIGAGFTVVDRHFGELDRTRLDAMVEATLRS